MRARQLTRWPLFGGMGMIALVVLAACGGGSGTPSAPGAAGPGGGGTGSDASYVADICKASKTFTDDLAKVTKDPTKLKDPSDVGKLLADPIAAFAKSMSKAKPPSDLKDYHNQMVKSLNDYAQQLKNGTADAMMSPLSNLPEPPKGAQDRLGKVAAQNTDCASSGFFGQ